MTISINMTITFDANDVATLLKQFVTGFTQAQQAAAALAPTLTHPTPATAAPAPKPVEGVESPVTSTTIAPKATKATSIAKHTTHNRRTQPTLPFDDFDQLVRKEMKRLSLDHRLPNRRLWDEERDPRLPTLDAVRARYKCNSMDDLASEMGLEPPLNARTNGVPVPMAMA